MSNLKLPEMSYASLSKIATPGKRTKLAYETTVETAGGAVIVRHHGHKIATITAETITLMTAGWDSRTTSQRLHAIAVANGLHHETSTGPGFGVAIRGGLTSLIRMDASRKPLVTFSELNYRAAFLRSSAGEWWPTFAPR